MSNDLERLQARVGPSSFKILKKRLKAIERIARSGSAPVDLVASDLEAHIQSDQNGNFAAVEDGLAEWLVKQGLLPVSEAPNGGPWRRDLFHSFSRSWQVRLDEVQAMGRSGLNPYALFGEAAFTKDGQARTGIAEALAEEVARAVKDAGFEACEFHRNVVELAEARRLISLDKSPIGAFASLLAGRPEQWRPIWLAEIERQLDTALKAERYEACPEGWRKGISADESDRAQRYFRPGHVAVLDRIDAGEPLIIVGTREARRIAREVIDSLGKGEGRRPTFIWSIGSGLFQVVHERGKHVFHEVTEAQSTPRVRVVCKVLPFGPNANEAERTHAEMQLAGAGFEPLAPSESRPTVGAWWKVEQASRTHFEAVAFSSGELDSEALDELRAKVTLLALERLERRGEGKIQHPGTGEEAIDPTALARLLTSIATRKAHGAVYVLHDVQRFLDDAASKVVAGITISAIRDAAVRLRRGQTGTQVLLLTNELPSAPELEEVAQVDIGLPSKPELANLLAQRLKSALKADADGDMLQRLVDSAAGMTLSQVLNSIRPLSSCSFDLSIILEEISRAKKVALRRSGALELVPKIANVELGGMDRFQAWLEQRRVVFERPAAAAAAGILRPPRGVLLVGIPGSGKSLAAREVARQWDLPLLRLDLGSVQDKFVGESERNMREALRAVSAMSPCVLWIDEIEKGISDDTYENRSSMNTRATLLTWLQESSAPAFVVATANRMGRLPPELTRAGRFDAQFFFGCPNDIGRSEILDLHLVARNVTIQEEKTELIARMIGFTGAEIEQVVLNACYRAFADAGRAVELADLQAAVDDVKPIVASFGKELEEVWNLIEQGRVLPASAKMLERTDILKLTDPDLFFPMYCGKETIHGWEKFATRADRKLMEFPSTGRKAVVMGTGDPEWIYVQTNFPFAHEHAHNWKFLDRKQTLSLNGAFDILVAQFAIESILFDTIETWQALKSDERFRTYREFFIQPGQNWPVDTKIALEDAWQ